MHTMKSVKPKKHTHTHGRMNFAVKYSVTNNMCSVFSIQRLYLEQYSTKKNENENVH